MSDRTAPHGQQHIPV